MSRISAAATGNSGLARLADTTVNWARAVDTLFSVVDHHGGPAFASAKPEQRVARRQWVARSAGWAARMHVTPRELRLTWRHDSIDCGYCGQWAWVELNYRPHAYQACALTT